MRVKELVLVGGGHAHVQVLRRWAEARPSGARVTLVVDTPVAVYSGMVPGFVAGQYRAEELEIDVLSLARCAGVRVVLGAMVGLDTERRTIRFADRPALPFDVASLDVGSSVAGLDLPGVREHALATRPIGGFVTRIAEVLARSTSPLRVIVVGGGAGGVEIAFTLRERLARSGPVPRVTLVNGASRILAGYPDGLVERVLRRARARGIEVRDGVRVVAADPRDLMLADGGREPFDLLAWATGASAGPALDGVALLKDPRGFLHVRSTLEVEGREGLFAAGDCAHLVDFPWTPKAGVYAVRQGPLLGRNLEAALVDRPLGRFRPQRDFLTLLNMGDGTAIGSKWGVAFEGRFVMRLKDAIDRRFVRRFRISEPAGPPSDRSARVRTRQRRPQRGGG